MKMNLSPSFRKVAVAGVLSAVALAFVVVTGHGQSQAAPKPAGHAAPDSSSVAAGPKVETENYVVEMRASGTYEAGREGNVTITIAPKGSYHMNSQYPYKFTATAPAPEGLTYPKPVLARADGTFDEKSGTFKLPFIAAKAGKAKISGRLSMSVCSEANCLMEKLDLDLDVDVK